MNLTHLTPGDVIITDYEHQDQSGRSVMLVFSLRARCDCSGCPSENKDSVWTFLALLPDGRVTSFGTTIEDNFIRIR